MSTPEEAFEIAVDDSRDPAPRKDAIDDLEAANACDELSDIARRDDLEDQYRELAVENLATPQCKSRLRALAESDETPAPLRERARTLLEDTPDDSGAGP